jgi:hypothetical protein
MTLRLALLLSCTLALSLVSPSTQPSTLIVHHNANLRAQPSTQSPIRDHLLPGDALTLVAQAKTAGFWHVRTAAGVEGWVYQTLVHQEEVDEVPAAPAATTASSFDPLWPKPPPVGSALKGPPGTQPCPADGEPGGDLATNRRKNRRDVPSSYQSVSFDALMNLPKLPDASTNRNSWTQPQLDAIAPFEGVAVSVIGFIVAVKKQSGGGGEATNCHFSAPNFVDVHVALVRDPGQGEKDALVVEPTPRFYTKNPKWIWSQLKELDDSTAPVRISGWTLFDPVHKGHLGTYRQTLWEIHPITKIEVFKNGQWVSW